MPVPTSTQPPSHSFIVHHASATDFLSATFPTLYRHEASSNIVLAHALKLVGTEAALTGFHFTNEADVLHSLNQSRRSLVSSSRMRQRVKPSGPFWLTLWSSPSADVPATLDIVLSSVSNSLGDYPIFLWTPKSQSEISSSWLVPRIEMITEHLFNTVPVSRVFSVFGMTVLTKIFARSWTRRAGVSIEPEPFYAAYYTYCNRESFIEDSSPLPPTHNIRRAVDSDRYQVAQLCKEFADDSVYFPLSLDRALLEAEELISKGLIWVYEADGSEIATICAVTRSSHNVSAITKVYTTPKWRCRGFAEHLVRNVTRRLLTCGKGEVTLYVGHSNSAQRVYDRVGFVGLCGKDKPSGVEDSLELGFVTGSPRGHW